MDLTAPHPTRSTRSRVAVFRRPSFRAWTPFALRLVMLSAGLLAVAGTVLLGPAAGASRVEPDLVNLLRGMAIVKAAIVCAAVGLAWWRFGLPIARQAAVVYVAGIVLMAGATVGIWQLSSLLPSAIAFHVGMAALLLTAWRGDDAAMRPR